LNLNNLMNVCTDEKKYSIEEFLAIFAEAKKDKDVGHLEDYLEVLKLFDKDGNGFMPGNQLQHMLIASGEIYNLPS
jgi:myosin light chain 6